MMNAKTTGDRIAQLRKEKRLIQKQLADALYATDKAISKQERRLNFPELTLLEKLARQL